MLTTIIQQKQPGWSLSTTDEEFYGTFYPNKETPEEAKIGSTVIGGTEFDSISNKLGEPNIIDANDIKSYRDFYYASKLGYDPKSAAKPRRETVRDYMEGLHWVLHYYHKGCGAWNWYFPHLYAPLATDIVNLKEFYPDQQDEEFQTFDFNLGKAFPSLGQLLSVLPPQSAVLLPPPLGELMTNSASPIASFYPKEFTTDANGKRQSWEAVVKVPFIRADLLLDTVNSIVDSKDDLLSTAERRRNVLGKSHTYVPENFGQGSPINYDEFAPRKRQMNNRPRNGRGRPQKSGARRSSPKPRKSAPQ